MEDLEMENQSLDKSLHEQRHSEFGIMKQSKHADKVLRCQRSWRVEPYMGLYDPCHCQTKSSKRAPLKTFTFLALGVLY